MSPLRENEVSLLNLARTCREKAEAMTSIQLDDWYKEHVGYRLSDEGWTNPAEKTVMVASSMFFNECPAGLETPGAEHMQRMLEASIENGTPL